MWIISIIVIPVSLLPLYFGFQIKNRQRIDLIHSYHHKSVKQEDIPQYTALMGTGMYCIGAGCLLYGIAALVSTSALISLIMPVGIVIGFAIMHKAQKKYNGCWFS